MIDRLGVLLTVAGNVIRLGYHTQLVVPEDDLDVDVAGLRCAYQVLLLC